MAFQRRQLLRILSFGFGSSFILTGSELGIVAQTPVKPAAPAPPAGPAAKHELEGTEREKVAGIGGFFFRAHDPKALALWYQQHLGILLTPSTYEDSVWQQEAGPTVFDPMPETSDLFGEPHKVWMLNFRVGNLDRMVAQLRGAGIEVKVDPQTYPNGRFASLHDPEGNPIALWQPAKPGAPH